MSTLFKTPAPVEGGEVKAVNDFVDVIVHDYEQDGLVFVVNNKDTSPYTLKFDFAESENLKLVPAENVATTESAPLACSVVLAAGTAANLCHLAVVDLNQGGYGMKYKVTASKTTPGAAGASTTTKTDPNAKRDRRPLNDKLAVLVEETDDGYVLYLENSAPAVNFKVEIGLGESKNLAMQTAPNVEAMGPLDAKTTIAAGATIPLVKLSMIDAASGTASLKYKVVMTEC
jgi:hypothetical protein